MIQTTGEVRQIRNEWDNYMQEYYHMQVYNSNIGGQYWQKMTRHHLLPIPSIGVAHSHSVNVIYWPEKTVRLEKAVIGLAKEDDSCTFRCSCRASPGAGFQGICDVLLERIQWEKRTKEVEERRYIHTHHGGSGGGSRIELWMRWTIPERIFQLAYSCTELVVSDLWRRRCHVNNDIWDRTI